MPLSRVGSIGRMFALGVCLTAGGCIEGKERPGEDAASAPDAAPDLGSDAGVAPGVWVAVKPGTFVMGRRPDSPCFTQSRRTVTLTRGFQISATEVTRAQYEAVVGSPSNPGSTCDTCPAAVLWYRAAAYCNALSDLAGLPSCYQCAGDGEAFTCIVRSGYRPPAQQTLYDCPGYRLPTEAEWEYAYRAGTSTDHYNGDITETSCVHPDPAINVIAWYCGYGGDQAQPVAQKQPNSWGLYDMAGNASEWCDDGYVNDLGNTDAVDPWIPGPLGPYYASRGGYYRSSPCYVQASARWERTSTARVGFRCVRSLPGP